MKQRVIATTIDNDVLVFDSVEQLNEHNNKAMMGILENSLSANRYYSGEKNMKEEQDKMDELDVIEDILEEKGVDIENYSNPEKGISRLEAICNALDKSLAKEEQRK